MIFRIPAEKAMCLRKDRLNKGLGTFGNHLETAWGRLGMLGNGWELLGTRLGQLGEPLVSCALCLSRLTLPGLLPRKHTKNTKAGRSHDRNADRSKHSVSAACSIRGLGRLTKLPSPVAGDGPGVRARSAARGHFPVIPFFCLSSSLLARSALRGFFFARQYLAFSRGNRRVFKQQPLETA